jgi:glyoxylase-like metal-dependent hydrolase (beta-lactamase superfamily II)
MKHEILPVGALQCNCSVFADETTNDAIVIDPGDGSDLDVLENLLDERGWRVTAIVITHAHIDHIGGAAKLKALTGAPVYMHAADHVLYEHIDIQAGWLGMRVPERTEIDEQLRAGDTLKLGEREFHVLYTPGHTPGSVCLLEPVDGVLVAGDTLFRDSIGRTDLPGGDGRRILQSIHSELLVLDDATRVICGHGPQTTIGREKEMNPFL